MKFFNKFKNFIKKIIFLIKNNNCKIKYDIKIFSDGIIKLGNNVSIDRGSTIYVQKESSLIIKDNVFIGKDLEINSQNNIFIGENTTVQSRANIFGDVRILSNCIIGPNVYMSSFKHIFSDQEYELIRKQDVSSAANHSSQIIINEDCFIGINVFIKPGVTVGRGSIIGANTNVLQNIEPYNVVSGNPAKVIKKRLIFLPPEEINSNNQFNIPYFYKGFQTIKKNNLKEIILREKNFIISLNLLLKKKISLEIISDFSSSLILKKENTEKEFSKGKSVLEFSIIHLTENFIEFECTNFSKKNLFQIIKAKVY